MWLHIGKHLAHGAVVILHISHRLRKQSLPLHFIGVWTEYLVIFLEQESMGGLWWAAPKPSFIGLPMSSGRLWWDRFLSPLWFLCNPSQSIGADYKTAQLTPEYALEHEDAPHVTLECHMSPLVLVCRTGPWGTGNSTYSSFYVYVSNKLFGSDLNLTMLCTMGLTLPSVELFDVLVQCLWHTSTLE